MNNNLQVYVLLIISLFSVFTTANAENHLRLSEEEIKALKSHIDITIYAQDIGSPYIINNGELSGYLVDYVELINKKLGSKFKVSNKYESQNSGLYFSFKNDNSGKFNTLKTITNEQYVLFHNSKKNAQVKDSNLSKNSIGILLKDKGARYLLDDANLVYFDNTEKMINALLAKEVDFIYGIFRHIEHFIDLNNYKNNIIPVFSDTNKILYYSLYIDKELAELTSVLHKAIVSIENDQATNIERKWIPTGYAFGENKDYLFSPEEKQWMANNPVVRIGTENKWAPYSFVDSEGKFTGLVKDYIDEIKLITGLEFEVVTDSWASIDAKLDNGDIDLIPTAYFEQNKEKEYIFSKMYVSLIEYFFIHKKINQNNDTVMNNLKLAIPDGYPEIQDIKEKMPNFNIIRSRDPDHSISLVLEGKADALFDTYSVVSYLLENKSVSDIVPFKQVFFHDNNGIHFKSLKKNFILISIIQKSIDNISAETKKKILKKWANQNGAVKPIYLSPKEKQWIKHNPVINFVVGNSDSMPFEAFNKKGKLIGIISDYLKIIEDKLGLEINIIKPSSWDSYDAAQKHNAQIISGNNYSSKILNNYRPVSRTLFSEQIVIATNNNHSFIGSLYDIADKKIALIENYQYVDEIERMYPEINFYYAKNIKEAVELMLEQKYDVIVAPMGLIGYYTSNNGVRNVKIVGRTELVVESAIYGLRENEVLNNILTKVFDSIYESKRISINNKWGRQHYIERIDYKLAIATSIIFMFILAWFMRMNFRMKNEILLRKKYQDDLELEKKNFEILFSQANEGNCLLKDFVIINCNQSFLNIIGYQDKSEIMGLTIYDLMPEYHSLKQIFLQQHKTIINTLKNHDKANFIWDYVKPNNEKIVIDSMIRKINYLNDECIYISCRDITKNQMMEKKLQKSIESANHANQSKTEFLANISHEIRTPMNSVIGFAELLEATNLNKIQKNHVISIKNSGRNLLKIINGVLDLSKIEAGKLKIETNYMNLHSLLEDIQQIFMPEIEKKGLEFNLNIPSDFPATLYSDDIRIRQIILNLVGNAIKFTEKGFVRIHVAYSYTSNKNKIDIEITVSDSGIGIAKDSQELIFGIFEQQEGQSNEFEGTGLGLSISKKLALALGGELSVISEKGAGSQFTLSLKAIKYDNQIIQDSTDNKIITIKESTIIIADDNIDNRKITKGKLEKQPVKIIEASNGQEVIELLSSYNVDAVLMDLKMPIMDGYQSTEIIKASDKTSHIPVIAVTASVFDRANSACKKKMFDGIVYKPLQGNGLLKVLNDVLSRKDLGIQIKASNTIKPNLDLSQKTEFSNKFGQHIKEIRGRNNFKLLSALALDLLDYSEDKDKLIRDLIKDFSDSVQMFDTEKIKISLNNICDIFDI